MSCINFGNIDKNLIAIIVGCVFCFLNRLLFQYDGSLLIKNSILTNIFASISKLFILIPYIIFKRRTNKATRDDISNPTTNQIKLIYTDNDRKMKKSKYKYIILSALVFFVQSIVFVLTLKIKSNCWILDIFFTTLFYYWIFRIRLYKHHYFSGILIIIIGLIIDLVLGNLQNDITNQILLLLLRLFREILYSFHDVIDKYIILKKFGSIYEIGLFTGIINLILLGIFVVFDYNYFGLDKYEEYFNNFNCGEILIIFGVMICQLGLYLCLLLTNKIYTPCHIFIIFVFGQLAYYKDFIIPNSIIVIICLIFILFLSLIFNEIIEVNFRGLSKNTKRNIILRSENEGKEIEKINEFDENEEDEKNEDTAEIQEE